MLCLENFRKSGERKLTKKEKNPHMNPTKLEETSLSFCPIFFQSLFQSFKGTGIILYELRGLSCFFFSLT